MEANIDWEAAYFQLRERHLTVLRSLGILVWRAGGEIVVPREETERMPLGLQVMMKWDPDRMEHTFKVEPVEDPEGEEVAP